MTTYIIKRLLLIPLMLFGITLVSFSVIILAPGTSGGKGSTGDVRSGKITQQQLEVMQRTFHVGKPLHLRYLYWLGVLQAEPTIEEVRGLKRKHAESLMLDASLAESRLRAMTAYLELLDQESRAAITGSSQPIEWPAALKTLDAEMAAQIRVPLRGILFGDFGMSVHSPSIPVSQKIAEALPVTLIMNIIALFIIYTTAIPLGIFSATRHNSFADRSLTILLFALYSLPSFWVAILSIKFMVWLPEHLRLPFQGISPPGAEEMPTVQFLWESTKHLFLPVFVECYGSLAGISRYMRTSMLDVIRSDFVRTARAKGCVERIVVFKHAMRNSLIPIVTLLGGLLPSLIGGAFIIETIFGIPGMGYLGYMSVLNRDYTVLMALFTISAVLTLFGILLSDILYVLVDPRISFEKGR